MCCALASSWIAFANTGDPNNGQIPHWPRFNENERATMVFNRNTRIERDPYRELREFWSGMPPAASVLG
jgi:para-nitrobenzyl esterase